MNTESQSLMSIIGDASEAMPLEFAEKLLARSASSGPAFLQSGTAPSGGSYSSQSGAIFGILTTMKEEFEANLGQDQKDEQKAQVDFDAMSAAKSAQIATGKEKLDALE